MRGHWAYFSYVLRHKWHVFWEAIKLGIPWLGLIHDWDKFLPSIWLPYVRHYFNSDGSVKEPFQKGDFFDYAWLAHRRRAQHHWQWWVLFRDDGTIRTLPMPKKYRREMLADWLGTALAHGRDVLAWYAENKNKLSLHPETREWIEARLYDVPRRTAQHRQS